MKTAAEYNKLKVEELQKLLKEKSLPTSGKKAELVQVRASSVRPADPARSARASGSFARCARL